MSEWWREWWRAYVRKNIQHSTLLCIPHSARLFAHTHTHTITPPTSQPYFHHININNTNLTSTTSTTKNPHYQLPPTSRIVFLCLSKPLLGRRMRKYCAWPAASRAICVTSRMRGCPLPPQSVMVLSM